MTTTPKSQAAAIGQAGAPAERDNRMPIEDERKAAEYEYSVTSFDYVANPIGSRDWTIYWAGWLARSTHKVAAPAGAQQADAEFLAKRLSRVAKLVGAHIPEHFTHEQIVEVAGTILGDVARQLESRAQQARDNAARDAKDAARYRWLRDADELPFNLMSLDMVGDKFDAAIDAAMSAQANKAGKDGGES